MNSFCLTGCCFFARADYLLCPLLCPDNVYIGEAATAPAFLRFHLFQSSRSSALHPWTTRSPVKYWTYNIRRCPFFRWDFLTHSGSPWSSSMRSKCLCWKNNGNTKKKYFIFLLLIATSFVWDSCMFPVLWLLCLHRLPPPLCWLSRRTRRRSRNSLRTAAHKRFFTLGEENMVFSEANLIAFDLQIHTYTNNSAICWRWRRVGGAPTGVPAVVKTNDEIEKKRYWWQTKRPNN